MRTQSGILIPPLPQPRPKASGRRRSITMGIGALIEPDGSVAWQDSDWQLNALHDAGEQSMLLVYLKEQANPTKYLALLNQATASGVAATDVFTQTAHGYVDGDQITLGPLTAGVGTGITSGQVYFVRDSSANTFKVAATSGGTAIDFTADGTFALIGEKRGTMAATNVVEMKTPASGGYDRQQVLAADWTDDGVLVGDYRFSAVEKSFGPMTVAPATATHAALTTTLTSTAGLLLLTVPLSAATTIALSQSFRYILRWTQQ